MQIFYMAGFKNKKEAYNYMKWYSLWTKYELSLKLLYCYMHTYDFFKLKSVKTLKYNPKNSINIKGLLYEILSLSQSNFIKETNLPEELELKDKFCEAVISKQMVKQVSKNIYPYYELLSKLNRPTVTLILTFIFGI